MLSRFVELLIFVLILFQIANFEIFIFPYYRIIANNAFHAYIYIFIYITPTNVRIIWINFATIYTRADEITRIRPISISSTLKTERRTNFNQTKIFTVRIIVFNVRIFTDVFVQYSRYKFNQGVEKKNIFCRTNLVRNYPRAAWKTSDSPAKKDTYPNTSYFIQEYIYIYWTGPRSNTEKKLLEFVFVINGRGTSGDIEWNK